MRIIVFLLLALLLTAQTKLPVDLLKGGTPAAEGQILVFTSTGQFRLVTIGSGLTLTCPAAGACTLGASALAARQVVMLTVPAQVDSYTLTAPPVELEVVRNGLELSAAVDYTVSGAIVTFLAGAKPQPGDILKFKFR